MEEAYKPTSATAFIAQLRFAPVMAILAAGLLSACAMQPTPPQTSNNAAVSQLLPLPPPAAPELLATGPAVNGTASWYGVGAGLHRTCSGQVFNGTTMTAASHSIPLGTQVRVALLGDASHSIVVRVNDCMPREGRILDLSRAAAVELGILDAGVAEVSVTPVIMLADNH